MGLSGGDLELLLRLKRGGHLNRPGAVMEIGAQQLSNSFLRERQTIDELGRLFGATGTLELPQPSAPAAQGAIELQSPDAPHSRVFWEWLGFQYQAVDIDGSAGSIPMDLNADSVPAAARGKFTLIVNAGTTEHVANQSNAFSVMHDLCAPDGLMLHNLPAQGMMNHGLINYNPKFFWILASSNDYKIVDFHYDDRGLPHAIPQDVCDFVERFGDAHHGGTIRDSAIRIAMQKRFDIPFVPPLDVPTGVTAPTPELRRRYWTLYEPRVLRRLELERRGRMADLQTAGAALVRALSPAPLIARMLARYGFIGRR